MFVLKLQEKHYCTVCKKCGIS